MFSRRWIESRKCHLVLGTCRLGDQRENEIVQWKVFDLCSFTFHHEPTVRRQTGVDPLAPKKVPAVIINVIMNPDAKTRRTRPALFA